MKQSLNESLVNESYLDFVPLAKACGISETENYYSALVAAATLIINRRQNSIYTIGLSGAQGSGKSTFCQLLAFVLEIIAGLRSVTLSMDDFYLTLHERVQLSRKIHPLLLVRGVPGTHDIRLMNEVISDLGLGKTTSIPRFDKATDDRESALEVISGPIDVLLIEGWCFGAEPESSKTALAKPINSLEANEDPNCIWREYVNEQLQNDAYQQLFTRVDSLFNLQIPDWSFVFQWRSQQERQLRDRDPGMRAMNDDALRQFVMYFERITRRMLISSPKKAQLNLRLSQNHAFIQSLFVP